MNLGCDDRSLELSLAWGKEQWILAVWQSTGISREHDARRVCQAHLSSSRNSVRISTSADR